MDALKDRFITIQAVAEILSCTERHIYDLIMAGSLVAIKVGSRAVRVSERSLREFIENSRVRPDDFDEPEPSRTETNDEPPPARSKWMSRQG